MDADYYSLIVSRLEDMPAAKLRLVLLFVLRLC